MRLWNEIVKWLAKATPEQRAKWEILPQGFGVYWDELDDGFEVEHAESCVIE